MPLTVPVRTGFDLARTLDLIEAVVAVDALLERRLISLVGLRSYAEGRLSWHGARRLEKVLRLAMPGAESPMETRLRLIVILGGLPVPQLQFPVRESLGRFAARLDLAFPEHRLGVEYDGPSHWRPEAMRSDLRRQNALRALGWTLLRFTVDDVLKHPERVIAQVASALRS